MLLQNISYFVYSLDLLCCCCCCCWVGYVDIILVNVDISSMVSLDITVIALLVLNCSAWKQIIDQACQASRLIFQVDESVVAFFFVLVWFFIFFIWVFLDFAGEGEIRPNFGPHFRIGTVAHLTIKNN